MNGPPLRVLYLEEIVNYFHRTDGFSSTLRQFPQQIMIIIRHVGLCGWESITLGINDDNWMALCEL